MTHLCQGSRVKVFYSFFRFSFFFSSFSLFLLTRSERRNSWAKVARRVKEKNHSEQRVVSLVRSEQAAVEECALHTFVAKTETHMSVCVCVRLQQPIVI